jgi:chemosensory pili system protein ChpA (sensor histidine kinase/response regulator)
MEVNPVFDQLQVQLGDPPDEDATSVLGPEEGQDILPILFSTEVEGCLQRLEAVLADPQQPCLQEELTILAQELGGLGEMLQLPAFSELCQSVGQAVEARPEWTEPIARAALENWRRSQELVLAGHLDALPTTLQGLDLGEFDWGTIAPAAEVDALLSVEAEHPLSWDEIDPYRDYGLEVGDLPQWEADAVEPEMELTSVLEETPPLSWDDLEPDVEITSEISDSLQSFWEPDESDTGDIPSPAPVTEDATEDVTTPDTAPEAWLNEGEWQAMDEDVTTPDTAPDPAAEAWLNEGEWQESDADWAAATPVEFEASPAPPPEPAPLQETPATHFKILEAKEPVTTPLEDETVTVRVSLRQLNALNDLFGELTIERNGLDLYLKRLRSFVTTLKQRLLQMEQVNAEMQTAYDRSSLHLSSAHPSLGYIGGSRLAAASPSATLSHFDVLEMDQYNELHLLSQQVLETLVQIQEVTGDIDLSLEDAEQTTRDLSKTARQLQSRLNTLRMRPLSVIVDRFPRALREMCLQHGKKARLAVTGASTLLDHHILDALQDPLLHLLRNAFDHGIEAPEKRQSQGKPEEGVIEIQASHRGNWTMIRIRDDGRGIPIDKIRAKAKQMGLDEALIESASDPDLLPLIFEPGFSTSDQVTSLSGRGVGMDVVRESLRQIRGEITVDTVAGEGTTFTLAVPFTLSVTQVQLVESHNLLLAFPTDLIEEMVLLESAEVESHNERDMLNLHGEWIPFVRLSQGLHFNCPHQPPTLETAPKINAPVVMVVNRGNDRAAIGVERCWGEQEVAIRRVEGSLPMPPGFTGCAIIGDGRIVPLVNVAELLSRVPRPAIINRERETTHLALPFASTLLSAATDGQPVPHKTIVSSAGRRTILIVDDSINVRRFLALTLERGGYRVEQAKDGQDGLEKLQRGLAVQGVICDVEMPRLDGFGFLAKVKEDAHLQEIPVAMLSSRSSDKHRQLAAHLGATAYFTKPYNEQELLRSLAEILATKMD